MFNYREAMSEDDHNEVSQADDFPETINDPLEKVQYERIETLHKGQFGVTGLAKATRIAVLKQIRLERAVFFDSKIIEIVRNEAHLLSRFSHPNIVRIYHAFEDPEQKTINVELEYCPGGNLKEVINEQLQLGELLPEDRIRMWFAQIAIGVSYIHSIHLVHRDLTSAHIYLSADRQTAKVGDFGTAKLIDKACIGVGEGLNEPGNLNYMAPERFVGDASGSSEVDEQPSVTKPAALPSFKIDVWAIGVILFEMTTLTLPFAISTDQQIMTVVAMVSIYKGKAKIGSSIDAKYSRALKTLINDKLLVIDAEKRVDMDQVLQSEFLRDEIDRVKRSHAWDFRNKVQTETMKRRLEMLRRMDEKDRQSSDDVEERLKHEINAMLQEFELERQSHEQEVRSLREIISELERERRTDAQKVPSSSSATSEAPPPYIDKADGGSLTSAHNRKSQDSILSAEDQNYLGAELLTAMVLGRPEQVSSLLDRGAFVNYTDVDNWTPLLAAALHGHMEIVQILLQRGADVHHKNNDGRTALHFAIDGGCQEIVKILFENGANANERDNVGWTPLVYAALTGRSEIGRFLIAKGADVNLSDENGATPLMHAAIHGRGEFGKILLENGAEINAQTRSKMTYFSSAKNKLVAIGPGFTALMVAAFEGRQRFCQMLCDFKADLTVKNSQGQQAFMLAKTDAIKKLTQLPKNSDAAKKERTLFVQIPTPFIGRIRKNQDSDEFVLI